ncbi:hypothetical protein [Nonomuraea aridisoli]|uniref:Uncharacterized protein n=1 Tax=Nonomuraea aridisoli TaxID=2070368 RepID=A0A2W2EKJ9_9ACTN|nr:hypothetical protein [Nonomuraea aridisoli]PZG05264.1 hypothetical protein C1J01_43705 [Nonomuraea aridisoli]
MVYSAGLAGGRMRAAGIAVLYWGVLSVFAFRSQTGLGCVLDAVPAKLARRPACAEDFQVASVAKPGNA